MTNHDNPARDAERGVVGTADPKTGIFRHGFGLKGDVAANIAGDYLCPVVERLKAAGYHLDLGPLQIHLAREAGPGGRIGGDLRMEDLHGHISAIGVNGVVHHSHPAGADARQQAITTDLLHPHMFPYGPLVPLGGQAVVRTVQ